MKFLWIFFLVRHKIGLYLGAISLHFRGFSKGQGTERRIFFGVAEISNIFGVLEIPDIFFWGGGGGVNSRCWARAYV